MIYEILEGENASFYRNLFMNMDYRASRKVAPHTSRQKRLMIHIKNTNKMQRVA